MSAPSTIFPPQSKFRSWIWGLSLQQKAWIISFAALAFFAVGLGIGIQTTFSRSFRELELHSVRESAERLQRALEQVTVTLEKISRDYAWWDDTYEYVVRPTPAFSDSNLVETVFTNLDLHALLIFHESKRLVAGRTYSRGEGLKEADPGPWTEPFVALIDKVCKTPGASARGLMRVPSGLAAFACLPIMKSDGSGPPRGAMIMVRLLNDDFVQKLRGLTVLDVQMHVYDQATASPLDLELLSHRGALPLMQTTDDRLVYHVLLHDAKAQPGAVFSVTMDRVIYKQGRRTTWISFMAIFIIGAFCTLVVVWLVRVQVIRPLEALHGSVNRIGRLRDASVRVDARGVDEIACLAREINQMLDALARAERDHARAKQESEHLQAQLMQAQKMEAIGTLAGGLAHDFNNMLNSIMGSADLLRYELPQGHAGQEHIRRIERAGGNASILVRQLLTVSRRQALKIEPLHLGELTQEVMRLLKAGLPKNIDFQFESLTEQDLVMADPAQLHQVIMNLATNSAHAMAGRERGIFKILLELVHLPVATRPETLKLSPGKYVRMTIADNGCGIPKENLEHIFEPFFSTKPMGTGTGLGLAMVHGIVGKHNGCISLQSDPGTGTSFTIHLPLSQESPARPATPTPAAQVAADQAKKTIVLLVDDDKLVRDTLGGGLKRLGYQVLSTGNASEAISIVAETRQKIDWVVTDHMMPETNGLDLGQQIQGLRHGIKMLLISGFAEALDEDAALSRGFIRMLTKPVTPIQLHEVIQSLSKKP